MIFLIRHATIEEIISMTYLNVIAAIPIRDFSFSALFIHASWFRDELLYSLAKQVLHI